MHVLLYNNFILLLLHLSPQLTEKLPQSLFLCHVRCPGAGFAYDSRPL